MVGLAGATSWVAVFVVNILFGIVQGAQPGPLKRSQTVDALKLLPVSVIVPG